MYEYMSWHVLLASTVGMCCTDCIVPFFSLKERKFKRYGDRWEWGGGAWGGGVERVQHPVCTCCSGESRPGGGGGRGGAYRGVCRLPHTL